MNSGDVERILKDVVKEITPTESERRSEKAAIDKSFDTLKQVIAKTKIPIEPLLVGSIAKDTDLRNNKDVDIFLLFDRSVPRENLEKTGLDIGREFFKRMKSAGEVNYAEHPYTKGKYRNYTIEVVPCYRIKKGQKIQSAVDRSPLHTEFVLERLKRRPKLKDEIRLLKQFMKANNVYGANAAVEGFSGYLCELLAIKYGGFMEAIKAIAEWERGEAMSVSSKRKRSSVPLMFIDPVDPDRNVAAAVSMEKLAGAVSLAQRFLEKPSMAFFYPKKVAAMSKQEFYRRLKTRQTELICVSFSVPQMLEDSLVAQLGKSLNALARFCEDKGFRVIKKGQWSDVGKAVLVLEFDVWSLPRVERRIGPTFDSDTKDIEGFIRKNIKIAVSKPYMEGDRWAIDVKRQYRDADDFIRDFMKKPGGFGKNLREVKKVRVYRNARVAKIKDKGFWEFMAQF